MRREEIGEGNGSAFITPSDDVRVASTSTWTLVYTCGRRGMKKGGSIKVIFPVGFSVPRILPIPHFVARHNVDPNDHRLPGYVTVHSFKPGVRLKLSVDSPHPLKEPGYREGWEKVYIIVEDGSLEEGEEVCLVYGDTRSGSPGACASTMAQMAEFRVATDTDGKGEAPYTGYYLIRESPKIRVVSDRAVKLILTAPSTVVRNEPFNLTVVARDKYGNVADGYRGTITFLLEEVDVEAPARYTFTEEDKGVHTFKNACKIGGEGIRHIGARDKSQAIEAYSNPIDCGSTVAPANLYWGDPHCHTNVSEAKGTPEESFLYARNVTRLDFCAIADHDIASVWNCYQTDAEWKSLQSLNGRFTKPHRFVTFLAYEFSCAPHKVVYYFHNDKVILRSSPPEKRSHQDILDKLNALWEELDDKVALVVPHQHTGFFWELHNPKFQRLAEVYSIHGVMEKLPCPRPGRGSEQGNTLQDGLARGYRLGFIASSDSHDGHPGYSLWFPNGMIQYRGGLTAVYALELTKEAIWNALWNRHCYATTGERIILDFRINRYKMGEKIKANDESLEHRKIQVTVAGTAKIREINIIRNNADIYTHIGTGILEDFEYVDCESLSEISMSNSDTQRRFTFYYVRVIQEDGEMAWSSPIWIDLPPK